MSETEVTEISTKSMNDEIDRNVLPSITMSRIQMTMVTCLNMQIKHTYIYKLGKKDIYIVIFDQKVCYIYINIERE